jgi:transcriptional regulator GlxA family with amidase domain
MDMCLELVRRDLGAAVANEVARRMVVPPHRDGGQAQYVRLVDRTQNGAGRDVQTWARHNLADATVARMASYAGVSTRTLNRRFSELTGHSPQMWLQRLRLDAAAELLEATDLSVDAVAHRVGLGTASNLRARFSAAFGVPPSRYRTTFGPIAQCSST